MKAFFRFWFELQKIHWSFCVAMTRCCVTYFGPSQPCIESGLKAQVEDAPTWSPSTIGRPSFSTNSVAATLLGFWVLFCSSFPLRNKHLHCNGDVEFFCCESGLIFLFFTTVAISLFMIRAWTPYLYLLHTHPQFQIACLYFLACVLRFACRISLLGEVNQVVLGW
jgi:hypothetical protein